MSSFDITKVKKLTKEDMDKNKQPKITLEGIKSMCNFLDEKNPATYEIYLKYRPDLAENEVAYYKDIIRTLHENNRLKSQVLNETFNTYETCGFNSKPEIIYDINLNHIDNPC
jgi:hypothetical protein